MPPRGEEATFCGCLASTLGGLRRCVTFGDDPELNKSLATTGAAGAFEFEFGSLYGVDIDSIEVVLLDRDRCPKSEFIEDCEFIDDCEESGVKGRGREVDEVNFGLVGGCEGSMSVETADSCQDKLERK